MKDPIFVKDKEVFDASCPAHPVNVEESSSPMPGLSPKQEPEVSLILQGQSHMIVTLTRLEQIMESLMNVQNQQAAMLSTIIEALAEDQDPDEMPATYMDGSPV